MFNLVEFLHNNFTHDFIRDTSVKGGSYDTIPKLLEYSEPYLVSYTYNVTKGGRPLDIDLPS